MKKYSTKIAVLGAGSWGTALASVLARNGHEVTLWGRHEQAMQAMAQTHINTRYLPDMPLPDSLAFTSSLDECIAPAEIILLAVPSHAFVHLVDQLANRIDQKAGITWATKGFEPGTGRFLHEVVGERLPDHSLAVITGPSFAKEVTAGLPTAVTVHGADSSFTHLVANLIHTTYLHAYTGKDMLGAELGGASKNVLAVATGIADGMALGLNARAGLITRGMNEILKLGCALGAQPETLMGLAGLGDLVLTCTGNLSRNRRLGLALGQGVPVKEATRQIGQAVESLVTVDEVSRLGKQHNLDLPIIFGMRAILHGKMTPQKGLERLLSRDQQPEYPQGLFPKQLS